MENSYEYNLQILKDLQNELVLINKRRKSLQNKIKNQSKLVDSLKTKPEKTVDALLIRDIKICKDLILEQKHISTGAIIEYVNSVLKNSETRWKNNKASKGQLDSNIFMTVLGKHIKDIDGIKTIKEKCPISNRLTTIWYV